MFSGMSCTQLLPRRAEKCGEAGEIIGVDEINPGGAEFLPGRFGIGRSPEAEFSFFGVGLRYDGF